MCCNLNHFQVPTCSISLQHRNTVVFWRKFQFWLKFLDTLHLLLQPNSDLYIFQTVLFPKLTLSLLPLRYVTGSSTHAAASSPTYFARMARTRPNSRSPARCAEGATARGATAARLAARGATAARPTARGVTVVSLTRKEVTADSLQARGATSCSPRGRHSARQRSPRHSTACLPSAHRRGPTSASWRRQRLLSSRRQASWTMLVRCRHCCSWTQPRF